MNKSAPAPSRMRRKISVAEPLILAPLIAALILLRTRLPPDRCTSVSSRAIVAGKNAFLGRRLSERRECIKQISIRNHVIRIPDIERSLRHLPLEWKDVWRVEHVTAREQ